MKDFVKSMMEEHKELVKRIERLQGYMLLDGIKCSDSRVEYANKSVQLSAMKTYEGALRTRLETQNIHINDNNEYFEKVG